MRRIQRHHHSFPTRGPVGVGGDFGCCPESQVRELPEDALCEHRVVQGSGHCCTALGCSVQKCLSQSIAAVQLELLQGSKHSLRRSASSRSSSSVENPVKTHHNSFPAGACAHVVSSLTFHCCPRVHPEQGLGSKQLTTPCHTDFNFKGYSSTPSIWPRLRSAVAGTGRVTLMLAAALKEVFE